MNADKKNEQQNYFRKLMRYLKVKTNIILNDFEN